MTLPTGPPGPYQMPPTQQPAVATGRKVSPAGYWIGGGILVVGCGIAIIWFIVAIVSLVNAPDDFVRIGVPGSEVVTLSDGDWIVYYESGSTRSYAWAPPSVDVTGPNGRAINVQYSTDSYSYSVDGSDGEALYQFHASTPGAYTIEASTVGEPGLRSDDQIAIGRPVFDGGRVGGILGSLALGAVSFLVGLVILIVTIVRRSRSRRPAYVPYQPPYGGGPPAPTPYGGGPYGGPPPGGPPPAPGGWAPPTNQPAPGWPPPAPGSSPWPAPGATPPSPDEPSAAPPPTPPAPAPTPSPWPAPDNRPPSG